MSNIVKIIIYFLILSFSASVTTALLFSYTSQNKFCDIIIWGTIIGPIFSLAFIRKKGIYGGCVLLITMAEVSLLCASLYQNYYIATVISYFLLGATLTSTFFLCPIITYYIRGQVTYVKVLPFVFIAVFSGLIMANPLSLLPEDVLNSNYFVLSTILLLLGGFFTVFSAWKHRLVLLK